MKAGGGRAKGAGYERAVSKVIVEAFVKWGICAEDCYRTPLSGGHRFASKTDPGDLCTSARLRKLFPYAVECKFYAKLDWHRLMRPDNNKSHWAEWYRQSEKAAGKTGMTPVVIFRENGSPSYILFPSYLKGPITSPRIRCTVDKLEMTVVLLKDFLEWVVFRLKRRGKG